MSKEAVGIEDLYAIVALIDEDKFEEALQELFWFHEVSKKSPGMGGVRLSYAIKSWLDLAKKYPPALESLITLRDDNKNLLLSGNGDFDNFHDFFAINQYLDGDKDTYDTFIHIHEKYPSQAKRFYHVVEDLLVRNRNFEVCKAYLADPVKKYKHIEKLHKLNRKLSKSEDMAGDDEPERYAEEKYSNSVCQLIEVLVAIGNGDAAKDIQKLALDYSENNAIKEAI